jgi:double zinc ribbon protein
MTEENPLCLECQAQVHPDWSFCSHCGTRLTGPETVTRVPQSPLSAGIPACGNCGAAVDTAGSFCWNCGIPLATGREPFIPAHPESSAENASQFQPSQRDDRASLGSIPHATRTKTPLSRRATVGSTLLLVGVAVLVVAILSGWYTYSLSASEQMSGTTYTVTASVTLYPLDRIIETITCQGGSACGQVNTTFSGTYPQAGSNGIGALYDLTAGLTLGGIAFAVAAVVLAFQHDRHHSRWAGTLAVVSVILVALAPTLLLATQPEVITAQGAPYAGPGSLPGGLSPRTSFFGSCSGTNCGLAFPSGVSDSGSWGPSVGWYLSWGAIAALLVGWLVIREPRKKVASPITPDMLRKKRYV